MRTSMFAAIGTGSERPPRRSGRRLCCAFLVGSLAFALNSTTAAAQERGTVTGTIVEAGSMAPLASVQVSIPGTGLGTLSQPSGRFIILNVPVGSHTLRAERVGYATETQEIVVSAGGTVAVDFQLTETALGLDEIVVTGTAGAARRREVGNSITQLNLSDIQEPVVDVDNLLQGRVAGAVVQGTGGAVGSGGRIRLRGNVSATLSNQPLLFIDGVRVRSDGYPKSVPPTGYAGRGSNTTASPLNDVNPADIERMEIIKGAAATTLYGTEASAGVIQIFTKKGRQGRAQWTAQIDQAAMHLQEFGPKFGLRGEEIVVPPGELQPFYDDYRHMFMDPYIQTGYRGNYTLSVRGGLEDLNYFLSGQFESITGVHKSEGSQKYGLRANLTFTPFNGFQIQTNNSYTRTNLDHVPNGGNAQGIHLNAQRRDQNYFGNADPAVVSELFDYDIRQYIDRFITGLTATWAPSQSWSHRLTFGYDLAQQESRQVRPWGFSRQPEGILSNQRWRENTLTFDYVGSWSVQLGSEVRSSLSFGGQGITRDQTIVDGQANEFPGPGDPTLSSGAQTLAFEERIRVVTGGFFAQNIFDLKNRYFLTVGLRVDGNSAFGSNLGLQAYPKLSASYVISDEPFWSPDLGVLKLRAAWGQAGRAPGAFDAVRTWSPVGFGGQPAFLPNNVGNPDLGPERTSELEFGFDGSFLDNRWDLDFTYYNQTTTDALMNVRQIPSEGFGGQQLENVGKIQNRGVEFTTNFRIVDRQNWGWNLGGSYYTNESEVLSLGGAPAFSSGVRGWVIEGEAVPVMRGNCITNPDEIADPVVESNCIYGPNQPTFGWQLMTDVRMPGGLLLAARGEYSGGNWMYSNFEGEAYSRGIRWPTCFNVLPARDSGDTSSLTARERGHCLASNADRDYAIMPADFFKVRELSLSAPVPEQWMPGASSATVTVSGRNLYRWTKKDLFGFTDPEASGDWNRDQSGNLGNVMILGATPPPSVWTFSIRVNF